MEVSVDLEGLGGDLGVVIEGLVALLRSLNTTGDLSRTASATLATLAGEGPRRLTALAAREGVTQPAMSQLIDRLAAAGLVLREADPSDGRAILVRITDEGRAVRERRRAERAERLAALLARLAPEYQARIAAALPALETLALLRAGDLPVPV
jgi:DNA-binding MarR family transcriptional regulator